MDDDGVFPQQFFRRQLSDQVGKIPARDGFEFFGQVIGDRCRPVAVNLQRVFQERHQAVGAFIEDERMRVILYPLP